MADHPDGIYHYTSVNIPTGVTVSFIPNAGNKPVVWLVQGDCVINGTIDVSGQSIVTPASAGSGGPGGYKGGNGGTIPTAGSGPGGGFAGTPSTGAYGGNAAFGNAGGRFSTNLQAQAGATYGNGFNLPLLGGSGGGGSSYNNGASGAGGGGTILIAASQKIRVGGLVKAAGGTSTGDPAGGGGSGGAIRLITKTLEGNGRIDVSAGGTSIPGWSSNSAGSGRIRLDYVDSVFGGTLVGVTTQGFQPIILPTAGQGIQLGITSIAGAAVAANPSGALASPDVIIPAQQTNPVPVVVNCTNIPLNTEISVVVHPANGADVVAVGHNTAGTTAASTATISLNLPRGGGIIYAKAVTGIGGTASATSPADAKTRSIAETGWTADGERFAKMEITAAIGRGQQITYITESGKRYPMPGL